jgi:hypothetical protein
MQDETREWLLSQFYSSLRVTYLAAQPAPGPDSNTASMHERIQDLLTGKQGWRAAYEIEQLLAFIMTDDQVAAELPRRLIEAKSLKLDYVCELDTQFNTARERAQPTNVDAAQRQQAQIAMRYILHRLINDLQWFYGQRIRRREAATRLLRRISILFLSALYYFFLLLFLQVFFSNPTAPGTNQATTEAARTSPAKETGTDSISGADGNSAISTATP